MKGIPLEVCDFRKSSHRDTVLKALLSFTRPLSLHPYVRTIQLRDWLRPRLYPPYLKKPHPLTDVLPYSLDYLTWRSSSQLAVLSNVSFTLQSSQYIIFPNHNKMYSFSVLSFAHIFHFF